METIVNIHFDELEVNVKINAKKNAEPIHPIVKIHVEVKLKINAKKNVETIVKIHV